MHILRLIVIVLLLAAPGFAAADLLADSVPDASTWYFHADFEEMRSTDAGKQLYGWMEREVFDEVREESGFDIGKEADQITAFSAEPDGAIVLIEGKISLESTDKLLALAAGAKNLETLTHKGKTFYFAEGEGHGDIGDADAGDNDNDNDNHGGINIDGFDGGVYFSFAIKNKIIAAATREQMESMLASNGKVAPRKAKSGTLFVLTAEKSLIQAGMKADEFEDGGDGGWNSNILKNTEQVAIMIADVAGKIAVEAQLIAKQPEMAESLASIVRGVISLQVFSDDMDPEISQVLQSTKVSVDGTVLKVSVALDPALVVAALED